MTGAGTYGMRGSSDSKLRGFTVGIAPTDRSTHVCSLERQ